MNGRTNSSDVTIQEINYGALIPLEAPTNLVLTPLNARVDITWTDPVDKVASPGGEDVALWDRTVIIRKAGSAPTGPDDGEIIYTETTRNQHQYDVYSDTNNVVNNTVYYYAVYAYTQMDVPSEPVSGNCKPIAGTPVYRGKLDSISPRCGEYGGSFNQYSIYAGGYYSDSYPGSPYWCADTYAYDELLSRQRIADLNWARWGQHCVQTENDFLVAGGYRGSAGINVEVYQENLTRTSTTSLPHGIINAGYTTFRGNAILAGGDNFSEKHYGDVTLYTPTLTRQSLTSIDAKSQTRMASNNKYAICAGGVNDNERLSSADAYNESLTKIVLTNLSLAKKFPGAASIDQYIVFINGNSDNAVSSTDAYDQSLTRITINSVISDYSYDTVAVRLGGYILAIQSGTAFSSCYVGLYDSSLALSMPDIIDGARVGSTNYGYSTIGSKYALFGNSMHYFEAV